MEKPTNLPTHLDSYPEDTERDVALLILQSEAALKVSALTHEQLSWQSVCLDHLRTVGEISMKVARPLGRMALRVGENMAYMTLAYKGVNRGKSTGGH